MAAMRHGISCQLASLLLAGMAAATPINNSDQNGQSADLLVRPGVTVTGNSPHAGPPLPTFPPTEFTDCVKDGRTIGFCAFKLDTERRRVLETCLDRRAEEKPPAIIQACNEALEINLLQGMHRYYLFVNRADAYFAAGDLEHALADYNRAIQLGPRKADLYCNRAVFYAAQKDMAAAVKDYDSALDIDPTLVVALRERAKIYETLRNFSGALADYSAALHLQPQAAALWSERGYVYLLRRDYAKAIKDEAEAVRLDPKLARAYFFRGAAFGGLGDSPNARSDIAIAVGLDPSLERYLTSRDTSATRPP
jgi:tetratricopeptide (TPR) repeat protein